MNLLLPCVTIVVIPVIAAAIASFCLYRSISSRLSISLLALSIATTAAAANKHWDGGSGNWSNAANWNGDTLPIAGDAVYIRPTDGVARTITYDYAGAPSTLAGLNVDLTGPGTARTTFAMSAGNLTNIGFIIGDFGRATFNHSGGTHTQNDPTLDGAVGYNAGGNGIYNLSGTAALSLAKDLYVGGAATSSGTVNQSGGAATIGRDLLLAGSATSTGSYAISGGALSVGNNLVVGNAGIGAITIQNDAFVHVNNELSINSTSTVNLNGGTLRFKTVGGTGGLSRINYTAGTIQVPGAHFSSALITSLFGAAPTIPTGKSLILELGGFLANGSSLVINGGHLNAADLFIDSLNSLSITAGGAFVGNDCESSGYITVSGPESLLHIDGSFSVATAPYFGSPDALLTVENGATVFIASDLHISHPGGSFPPTSAVNLNGGTIRFDGYARDAVYGAQFNYTSGTIQLARDRTIGADSTISELFGASPTIANGKGLTVEGTATLASTPLTLAGGTFAAGTIAAMPGGQLRTTQSSQVLGPVVALAGSVVDATGGDLIIGDATKVNGYYSNGTLQVGSRIVTLADANDAVFDSGALTLLGSGASPGTVNAANGLTLDFGGNITGYGTVSTPNNLAKPLINNGHITGTSGAQRITLPGYVKGVGTFDNVNITGTFSPGLSPTILSVGNLTLLATSTLVMELGGDTPGSGYDQLLSSGILILGGKLEIKLINGFIPAAGQTFDLFEGALSGNFSSVTFPMVPGLTWDTSQLLSGMLRVSVPGDFNHDGAVDAADYVAWRKNGGTPQGYNTWRAHFGETTGSGAALPSAEPLSVAVPEPNAMILMIFAAVGWCLCQRRSV
jgi:hypothetical protein